MVLAGSIFQISYIQTSSSQILPLFRPSTICLLIFHALEVVPSDVSEEICFRRKLEIFIKLGNTNSKFKKVLEVTAARSTSAPGGSQVTGLPSDCSNSGAPGSQLQFFDERA